MINATRPAFGAWTLFLDRDGVLNKRQMNGYVTRPEDYEWLPGSLKSLAALSQAFRHIVVVTNQQGVGKGFMKKEDLDAIHAKMMGDVYAANGRIDAIYAATGLRCNDSFRRKPGTGMALEAKKDFPAIRFDLSVMVGDTFTDMLFGHRMHMQTILISKTKNFPHNHYPLVQYQFASLQECAAFLLTRKRT